MDENKVITRFSVVSGGLVSRGSPVWGLSSLVGTRVKGVAWLYRLGSVAEVRSPSQKQVRLVSRHRRSDGLEGRGMRSEVTARVISFRFRKIQCTNGGGSPPGFVSCGVEQRRGGRILLLGVAFHRCLPKRHPHLPPARQPRLLRCNWRTDPGTRDSRPPFLCEIAPGARRLPCHLAHMKKAAVSRPQRQQIPVVYAGQLVTSQPPIHDNS